MVVLIIDQYCVFAIESEGQAPITAYPDCPMVLEIAAQLMQAPSRHVHIRRRLCKIEQLKPIGQSFSMRGSDAGLVACLEEPLNPGVPEAFDHLLSVARHASPGNEKDSIALIRRQYPEGARSTVCPVEEEHMACPPENLRFPSERWPR